MDNALPGNELFAAQPIDLEVDAHLEITSFEFNSERIDGMRDA
jgi:hypothetical protein